MTNAGTEDLDLFDEEEADGAESGAADGAAAAPPAAGSPSEAKNSKRINDLMSRAQKAEAQAAKFEKQLKAVRGAADGAAAAVPVPESEKAPEVPVEVRRWLDAAKGGVVDRLYGSDPRFATYGIDKAAIGGDTPEAVAEAVKQLSALIDKVETRVRNDTLAEHGMNPAPGGGGAAAGPNVGAMSDEEFEKFLAKHSSRSGVL